MQTESHLPHQPDYASISKYIAEMRALLTESLVPELNQGIYDRITKEILELGLKERNISKATD